MHKISNLHKKTFLTDYEAILVSAVGSVSRLAFGGSQVQIPGPSHSFASCKILVKGWTLSTG